MSYEPHLNHARTSLETARRALDAEIRSYPTPVSGCDAQYNHMIGQRGSITAALRALQAPQFVATPRSPVPGLGIESR